MHFLWLVLLLASSKYVSAGLFGSITSAFTDVTSKLTNAADSAIGGTLSTIQEVVGTPVTLKQLRFQLFTDENPSQPISVNPLNPVVLTGGSDRIFFIIHGVWQSSESPWVKEATKKLLMRYPESKVVSVDWAVAAHQQYPFAVYSTESIGRHVGDLLAKLTKNLKVPLSSFVLIGFSLGAQICGFTGKRYTELTRTKLPRIIALDPTGVLFLVRPAGRKLNRNDADIVHVIHTDGGKMGLNTACGTIDFYPNGGKNQPGCPFMNVFKISDSLNCDHDRASSYFIESVENAGSFASKQCLNPEQLQKRNCTGPIVSMGDLETTQNGVFFLETNSKTPFSKSTTDEALLIKVFGKDKLDVRLGEPGHVKLLTTTASSGDLAEILSG